MSKIRVGFDCETHRIETGNLFPRLVCASFWWSDDDMGVVLDRTESVEMFRQILEDPNIIIVGQNIAFDVGIMVNEDPTLLPLVFENYGKKFRCTKVQEQLLRIASNHPHIMRDTNLAYLVKFYLGKDISDTKTEDSWRLNYHKLDGIPPKSWPKDAYFYALDDAKYALLVDEKQRQMPVIVGYSPERILCNAPQQIEAAFALHLLSGWGISVDSVRVNCIKKELEKAVSKSNQIGKDIGVVRENGSRNLTALRELVSVAYGDNPPKTPKGNIKTSTDVLLESGDEMLYKFAQGDAAKKVLSTFIPALEKGRHSPINAKFNVLVRSGRTSSSKPNLQNIPRKGIRDAFIPRSGNVFCSVDYDTIELRALAHVHRQWFGKSSLADAFDGGLDPHLSLGASLMKISYDEALSRRDDPVVKEMRQLGKLANFGYAGGLGPNAFVSYAKNYGVNITMGQSQELRQSWFQQWPEMTTYFKKIGRETRRGEAVVVQEGSGRIRGGCSFTVACNTQFQGLTACGAKAALFNLYKEIYTSDKNSYLSRVRPVIFLHDEIIAEGPKENSDLWAEEIVRIMVETMQQFIPNIPITCEAVLMNRWYKDAQPVYDKNGRLQIWEP